MHRVLNVVAAILFSTAGAPGFANDDVTAGVLEIRFTTDEIRIIQDFYAVEARGKPGKKGGNSGLPPGIAKNLARGKPLPPGIAKQFLPNELINRLPPVPDGHERIIVAGKILLVEIATQVVRDVLTDVLFD